MTTQKQDQPQGQEQSQLETVVETVYDLIDRVEQLNKRMDSLEKTAQKKNTQRLGSEHGRKAIKDNQTGAIYPSKFAAGKAIASNENLEDAKGKIEPSDNFAYYRIAKLSPERLEEAGDDEAQTAWKKADEELQKEVEEANKQLQQEQPQSSGNQSGGPSQGKGKQKNQ